MRCEYGELSLLQLVKGQDWVAWFNALLIVCSSSLMLSAWLHAGRWDAAYSSVKKAARLRPLGVQRNRQICMRALRLLSCP